MSKFAKGAAMTTADKVKLKRLPHPVHPGAVRSYTTRAPFGRFAISLLVPTRIARKDSWLVEDRATGALQACWTLGEVLAVVQCLLFAPAGSESRFCVLSKPQDEYTGDDCVLYDRVTGKWWSRKRDLQLQECISAMESLAPHLPADYAQRQPVRFPPAPADWQARTSTGGAGDAGRLTIKRNRWTRRLGPADASGH